MASPPPVSDGGGGEIIDGPAGISFSCRAPRDSGNGNGNNKKPGRISPQSNLCSGPPPPPPSPDRHLRSKHTIVLVAVVVEADSLIESNKYMWGQGDQELNTFGICCCWGQEWCVVFVAGWLDRQ